MGLKKYAETAWAGLIWLGTGRSSGLKRT